MMPSRSFIERLAREAGEFIRLHYGQRHQIYHKGEIDLVTEVDRQVEGFLLEEITRSFPNDEIVSEESGGQRGDECCRWYIDPLDGTVNFAHGVPIFSVSIAYAQGESLRIGVVYDPLRDELFSAERGKGAYLNGHAISVSKTKRLIDSLLVTGFPYDIRTNQHDNLDNFARLTRISQGVRRLGSAALDLCYVAAGRFDGYWELSLAAYDLAAGSLIAREGGAVVTDIYGGNKYLQPPHSILAAPPELHNQMLEVLDNPRE